MNNRSLKVYFSCTALCFAAFAISNSAYASDNPGLNMLMDASKAAKAAKAEEHRPPLTDKQERVKGTEEIRKAFSMMEDVKWAHALPVKGLVMITNKDGTQVLASTDGRILIKGGEVFDGWNRSPIVSESQAKASWMATLDKTLGISVKDMSTYYMGDLKKSEPDIIVFLDPLSAKFNTPVFNEIAKLGNDIQAAFVLTPIINGKASALRARELWCAKDQTQAFSIFKKSDANSPIETLENCDVSKLGTTLSVVQFLQIDRLPYFINRLGLHRKGKPEDIKKFISQTE